VNEGCIRWYKNNDHNAGKCAFVMHDSFALWLLGVIPELFSEVILFHGTIFDFDFVSHFSPDLVICLQAERFFVRPPETGGRMLEFVDQQEREKGSRRRFADALKAHPSFLGATN
jgi:hypothetical protein